jgi:uncharacterized protein (UPF0276 family)
MAEIPPLASQRWAGERAALPRLGLGLGLRNIHFEHILAHWPDVEWFEAISENFMDSGGRPRDVLRKVANRYPVVLHGVSLSVGSADPLNWDYLGGLKALADEIKPVWISDHLCWTGVLGLNTHDLLPLPLTEATLAHVIDRVQAVQEFLDRPLVLENPSTYVRFAENTIDEPDFLRAVCDATGCGLLLDVNNVYVSCRNAGRDPAPELARYPFDRVVQMHLAGHEDLGSHCIDTHDRPVRPAVWTLFTEAWQRTGGASTSLEWDGSIPPFEDCHAEILKARNHMTQVAADPGKDRPVMAPPMVSTPIDFLVPHVMDSTQMEPS